MLGLWVAPIGQPLQPGTAVLLSGATGKPFLFSYMATAGEVFFLQPQREGFHFRHGL